MNEVIELNALNSENMRIMKQIEYKRIGDLEVKDLKIKKS